MKRLNVLLLPLLVLSLAACDRTVYFKAVKVPPVVLQDGAGNNYNWDIQVVEVEGCEYLVHPGTNDGWMTHKGNCKYCAGAPRPSKKMELEQATQPAKP